MQELVPVEECYHSCKGRGGIMGRTKTNHETYGLMSFHNRSILWDSITCEHPLLCHFSMAVPCRIAPYIVLTNSPSAACTWQWKQMKLLITMLNPALPASKCTSPPRWHFVCLYNLFGVMIREMYTFHHFLLGAMRH